MKKIVSILIAVVTLFAFASCALAESFTVGNGLRFNVPSDSWYGYADESSGTLVLANTSGAYYVVYVAGENFVEECGISDPYTAAEYVKTEFEKTGCCSNMSSIMKTNGFYWFSGYSETEKISFSAVVDPNVRNMFMILGASSDISAILKMASVTK